MIFYINTFQVIDPDDLPQRARWTIIATAFLLLIMCLLLVGVTLRMAPIIDDMGKSIFTLYDLSVSAFVHKTNIPKTIFCYSNKKILLEELYNTVAISVSVRFLEYWRTFDQIWRTNMPYRLLFFLKL
jgi:hypothetical protein